jgi:hypothetical protein
VTSYPKFRLVTGNAQALPSFVAK